jgi:flagellar protein FlbD
LILLSRLGGPDFALNPDLIERAEATPDTVITLVSGNKYVVRQTLDELVELICLDRAEVISAAEQLSGGRNSGNGNGHEPSRETARTSRYAVRGRELSAVPAIVPLHPKEG